MFNALTYYDIHDIIFAAVISMLWLRDDQRVAFHMMFYFTIYALAAMQMQAYDFRSIAEIGNMSLHVDSLINGFVQVLALASLYLVCVISKTITVSMLAIACYHIFDATINLIITISSIINLGDVEQYAAVYDIVVYSSLYIILLVLLLRETKLGDYIARRVINHYRDSGFRLLNADLRVHS